MGATGYTGRLTARRLDQQGLAFVAAGRSEAGLRALIEESSLAAEPLVFDAREPGSLLDRLEPGAIVVSFVGPFGLLSRDLVRGLAEREVIYLDVCGEQAFVLDSLEHNGARAESSGALLVHACAFESFLADLLARRVAAPGEELHDLSSYYWFDRHLASPGTRLTMKLVDRWRTVILRDGELRDQEPGGVREVTGLDLAGERDRAVFVPYPEVIFFAWSFEPRHSGSYLLVKEAEARFFGRRPSSRGTETSIEELLRRHERLRQRGPSPQQRAGQGFGVAVVAEAEPGERRVASLRGRDPYGLTAAILGWACTWLLAHEVGVRGVRSPGEVFPSEAFFESSASWPELTRDPFV